MKKQLNEFYRGEISELKRYLQLSDEEKAFELMVQMWEQVYGIIASEEYIGPIDVEGSKSVNYKLGKALYNDIQKNGKEQGIRNLKKVFPDIYNKVVRYLKKASKDPVRYGLPDNDQIASMPTFLYMDYVGDVKNQWLLHFVTGKNTAEKIYNQGFRKGVTDKTRLGLTNWLSDEEKTQTNTYNFAFDPNDLRHDEQLMADLTKRRIYGEQCIMFRASGIKVYHEADNQLQTIFNSNQASDFVWIRNMWEPLSDLEGNKYNIHNKLDEALYSTDRFMDAVNWVEQNYKQYKNVL